VERRAADAERRADDAERRLAEASLRIADLEYETWKPPRGTSLFVRLRWALAKAEPAFPHVFSPLKRLYRRLFRKPRHVRAPGP